MLDSLRIYTSIVWANYKFLSRFRIGPIFFTITNLISLIGVIFLWKSVFSHSQSILGLTSSTIISYAISGRIVSMLLFSSLDRRIANDVKKGDYLVNMLHPWDIRYFYLSIATGQTVLHLIWMIMPIVILGILIGFINYNIEVTSIIAGIFMLILGYINVQLLKLIIGFSSVNYRIGHRAIGSLMNVLIQVAGGLWFPITMLPLVWQKILFLLPFSSMGSITLLILNGIKLPISLINLIITQLVWTIIIWSFSRIILKVYLSKVGNIAN